MIDSDDNGGWGGGLVVEVLCEKIVFKGYFRSFIFYLHIQI